MLGEIALAAAKKYTDVTVQGAGAVKGKNCTVSSIAPITGGNRVTFQWELDDGTVETDTMDVMDGEQGEQGIQGIPGKDGKDGDDYVLTSQDKTDIANIVLGELPVAESEVV